MSRRALVCSLVTLAAACGPAKHNPDAGPGGGDGNMECTADGQTQCQGATFETCMGGSWQVTSQCPNVCDPALGCVDCGPGINYCVGNDVHSCTAQGTDGGVVMSCPASQTCAGGGCVDPCANAASSRSYIGCEYWAVDLDNAIEVVTSPDQVANCTFVGNKVGDQVNMTVCYWSGSGQPPFDPNFGQPVRKTTAGVCDMPGSTCPTNYTCQANKAVCVLDAQHSPYAIVVSNPDPNKSVDVTISDGSGKTGTVTVGAGKVQSLFPQQAPFNMTDSSLDWTMQGKKAYKVVSTAPIVAYQFNPLDNVGVFSNDASLLIPKATFDVTYIALTYDTLTRRPDTNDYNGYVTIVAPQDGTTVMVTPTANVRASTTNSSQGVITAGTTTQFTLNAYEVLNLEAVGAAQAGIVGPDLSGTIIQSADTKTFGVFAGTEATVIPSDSPGGLYTAGPCCADHLEEMMFPTSTWGKTFAIARSQVRDTMTPERDVLRVMAQKAGTTVTFNPAPAKGTCGTLDVGKFCEVEISADTAITANNPILVGHYLVSAIWQDPLFGDSVGDGDPSLAIAVPVEQFRQSYAILIPSQYGKNFVSIVVPTGSAASLDGTDVTSQLASFAGGAYKAGRLPVNAGPHAIACNGDGCGIEIYGYDSAVSYMFAGGLDLKQIVVN